MDNWEVNQQCSCGCDRCNSKGERGNEYTFFQVLAFVVAAVVVLLLLSLLALSVVVVVNNFYT